MRTPRLVLDWDGTVTEMDSLHMVLLQFGDVGIYERAEEELGRGLTLHQVNGMEFETVTAPLVEVVAWCLENVRVRPGLATIVERFHPLVVSGGFHELIEPILAREGVEVELIANRLDPTPSGWHVRWRDETVCAVCGEACKRSTRPEGPFIYAGDGYSDHCIALTAERIFARAGLAEYLDEQGVPYEPFETLDEITAALEA